MDADSTTERVADVTRRLLAGERLNAAQIAKDYGISYGGAYAMLVRMSRVLSLTQYRRGWYVISAEQPEPWN